MLPTDHEQEHTRRRIASVIEQVQQDAVRQLRQSGVPEEQALIALMRISDLCIKLLLALDSLYQEFDDIVAKAGREQAFQTWINAKAAGLINEVERALPLLLAEAISQIIADCKQQPAPQVITAPAPTPPRPKPQGRLFSIFRLVIWIGAMGCATVALYQDAGSLGWGGIGLLIPFLVWYRWGKVWWLLPVPLLIIGTVVWAFAQYGSGQGLP